MYGDHVEDQEGITATETQSALVLALKGEPMQERQRCRTLL